MNLNYEETFLYFSKILKNNFFYENQEINLNFKLLYNSIKISKKEINYY